MRFLVSSSSVLFGFLYISCCPTNHVYYHSADSCLWVTSTKRDAFASNLECQNDSGELVVIEDSSMSDFIVTNFGSFVSLGLWIGVRKPDTTFTDWYCNDLNYTNWDMGQPQSSSNDRCVITDGAWANKDCTGEYMALCQRKLDNCPNGSMYNLQNFSTPICYWVSENKTRYATVAQQQCIEGGGSLAVFADESQMSYIEQHYSLRINELVWLGINDTIDEDVWRTLDGELVNYFNWDTSEPNNFFNEDCAQMNTNFKWFDIDCSTILFSSRALCSKGINLTVTGGTQHTSCVATTTTVPTTAMEPTTIEETTTPEATTIIDETTTSEATTIIDETTTSEATTRLEETTTQEATTTSEVLTTGVEFTSTITDTTVMPEVSTTTMAEVSSGTAVNTAVSCNCTCSTKYTSNEEFQEMLSQLTVDYKETSAYRRKLISVYDERPSAKNVGFIGICILCLVIGAIVLLDTTTFWMYCNKAPKRTLRNYSL